MPLPAAMPRLEVAMDRVRRAGLTALVGLFVVGIALGVAPGSAPPPSDAIPIAAAEVAAVAWPPSAGLLVAEVVTGGASASDEWVELDERGAGRRRPGRARARRTSPRPAGRSPARPPGRRPSSSSRAVISSWPMRPARSPASPTSLTRAASRRRVARSCSAPSAARRSTRSPGATRRMRSSRARRRRRRRPARASNVARVARSATCTRHQ